MKTAISIPDNVFDAAEQLAKRLHLSRSELYALAVRAFVDAHSRQKITEALDAVHGAAREAIDPALEASQRGLLRKQER